MSLKGVDRIVTVHVDGVARIVSDLHENMWFTVLGHGFNSAAAVGTLDRQLEDAAGEARDEL